MRRNYRSGMDQYYDYIIKELSAEISRKDVYYRLIQKGYKGKLTAAYDYMNRIIKSHQIDIAVYRNSTAESIQKKKELQKYDHITRDGILRFLWRGMELSAAHKEYLMNTYPQLRELRACILEFRGVYKQKNMPLLYMFINRYKKSGMKELFCFAEDLERDLDAVENSVASPLSNGFVEGTNSKLKMVKRTMYGRCNKDLLVAKVMYRIC